MEADIWQNTLMSGFMKTVLKNQNRGLSGRFFSPEKVDDIKIKWEVSPFFLSLPRLSSFHYPPFSIFSRPVYLA